MIKGELVAQNLEMRSGDDKLLRITVADSAGNLTNISNASVTWLMSVNVDTAALLTKTTVGGGVTLSNPTKGVFDVLLVPADTAALEGDFYHEAQITDTGGLISTVVVGNIKIHKDAIV